MQVIRRNSAEELFLAGLEAIKLGKMVAPRGMTTIEAPEPVCMVLENPRCNVVTNPYRKLNYAFGLVEAIQMWNGQNDAKAISFYNKNMLKYSDDGEIFNGAYGPPFKDQKGYVLETLRKDRDSRQAVVTLWRPTPGPSKDIPCTVSLHFFVRDFLLHLNVYMRSNDIWLGFPYDVTLFSRIQCQMAAELGFKPGTLRHISSSLHMYAGDIYKAEFALRYPGKTDIEFNLPVDTDLYGLALVEARCRVGDLPLIKPNDSFFSVHAKLLCEHAGKKFNSSFRTNYPEPYRTLMEGSKIVSRYFKDSKDEVGAAGSN